MMEFTTIEHSERVLGSGTKAWGRVFFWHTAPGPYRTTSAAILTPAGHVFVGTSVCSPSDPFMRVRGRAKAQRRALEALRDAARWSTLKMDGVEDKAIVEQMIGILRASATAAQSRVQTRLSA